MLHFLSMKIWLVYIANYLGQFTHSNTSSQVYSFYCSSYPHTKNNILLRPIHSFATMASLHSLLFIFTLLRFNVQVVNATRQWTVDPTSCRGFGPKSIINFWYNDDTCVLLRSSVPTGGPNNDQPIQFPGDGTGYNTFCCRVSLQNGKAVGKCAYSSLRNINQLNDNTCLAGRQVRSTIYFF